MIKLIYILIYIAFEANLFAINDTIWSKLNNQPFKTNKSSYSFIVSGHFYGNRSNLTGYPANTVLANIDWINSSNHIMLMHLGDLFLDVKNDAPIYKKVLLSKIKKPIFNAVGNHDLTANFYQSNFGSTFFYFIINNDVHLILDTEINDGSIKNEQLELLKKVERLVKESKINNVFIYAHRTLFARSYKQLDKFFNDNTQSVLGNNFKNDVLPLLIKIQNKANVVWFSGSLGQAPASFFQFKDNNNIQYIATAIRGLKRDAFLIVNVNNGQVNFETKSLTNQKLNKFETYNISYWNKHFGEKQPFNYRLIPLYVKQTLISFNFWIGILTSIVVWFVLKKIIKIKWSKK